ncbi:hypothetical protein SporoP37_13260 [Sporosarcina sp. P37]|uniref:competence protein ComK n=1 Tax=unclassified Sporosarcina TaxID=2647733 RepID=UPI0009C27D05|nr:MULTISPECIES: competence protein ComK [unclassified Sporosarcina]ARD49072.1 hypothetical protein SporoP33_13055 [Sporosarcina sp. P33]ARK25530.1 hypothetical protein SporoP37_13260 [Sporosarcina sp. P37]
MKNRTESVITPGTSLVYPYYNETGKLCAVLLKDGEFVRVDKSPTDVIDVSMQYFGSSLQGGIAGARSMLGRISMSPVMINEKLDMYWFPSKSPSSDDCVWFSLSHILTYMPIAKDRTKIIFRDGTIFTLDCSYDSFEWKHQRTCMYKNGLEAQINFMADNVKKSYKTYLIRRNRKRGNYEVSDE